MKSVVARASLSPVPWRREKSAWMKIVGGDDGKEGELSWSRNRGFQFNAGDHL
jgi:hypothetical protein